MKYNKETIYEGLKSHFGFETFKGTQEKIITSLLDGKDTFVIMPTGGGKSMHYVILVMKMVLHIF